MSQPTSGPDPSELAAAGEALEATGETWTPLRAAVYQALRASPRPISAYDVADAVQALLGRRVTSSSVYRILHVLVTAGVASRIESAHAYVANRHPNRRPGPGLLICEACGAVEHGCDDRSATLLMQVAREQRFTPARLVMEIHGTCPRCLGLEAAGGRVA